MKKEFNDKLKDIASAAAGPTLEIVSENLIEGVARTIVPGDGIRFCFCCPISHSITLAKKSVKNQQKCNMNRNKNGIHSTRH